MRHETMHGSSHGSIVVCLRWLPRVGLEGFWWQVLGLSHPDWVSGLACAGSDPWLILVFFWVFFGLWPFGSQPSGSSLELTMVGLRALLLPCGAPCWACKLLPLFLNLGEVFMVAQYDTDCCSVAP